MTALGVVLPTGAMYEDLGKQFRQSLRYHLLGPLQVFHGDEPRTPSAPKQQALIALLALHPNRPLPAGRIIDELWGPRPPRSATAALHGYVTAVRRCLVHEGDPGGADPRRHPVLRTLPSGYVLLVEPEQLDLCRFRALAAQARTVADDGRCAAAGELFRRALGLWRGTPLADLDRIGALARHVARLEDERLLALEERIDVDLCQGRGREVVGEIEDLCLRHPLREGFHRQLMLALLTVGRRADALLGYTRAYRIMTDEAGIEPGPELRQLQQAILAGHEATGQRHAGHRGRRSGVVASRSWRRRSRRR
jgi:DNA-binding SARP family transcriptional activator